MTDREDVLGVDLPNPGLGDIRGTGKRMQYNRDLVAKERAIQLAYQKRSADDFLCFVRGLTIDSQGGPRIFDRCMADYQRSFFEELAPSVEALRKGDKPEWRRFWVERTKKAGKDSDLAVVVLWLLAFPIRPFYIQIGAANKEQAAIVKARINHLLHHNKWLNERVTVVQWSARSAEEMADGSPMANLHIMSSDIAGAHGGTPDLLVINELSHVNRWEFAENLMDNADGVAQGVVIIATNAGYTGSKAEVWRKNAMESDVWRVFVWARPAPWHDKSTIEDAKKRNPRSRYLRLWWGVWVSGKGDAVAQEVIESCFSLEGPALPDSEMTYIAGLDLGVSHDHAGFAVLGVHYAKQQIITAYWKRWKPKAKTGEVDLIDVERECRDIHKTYRLMGLFFDPHQAALMAQRLRRKGVPMRKMSFASPANLIKMATAFVQVISDGRFHCYDDEEETLKNDFGKFDIEEKTSGQKLVATSDQTGHADVGTAVAIALPAALELLEGYQSQLSPDDDIIVDDGTADDLTEEEMDAMPDELREICDSDESEEASSLSDLGDSWSTAFD